MTAQEQQQFDDLKKQVDDLQSQIKALSNNATIPFDVGEAMKVRILSDAGTAELSTKLATSEDTTVVTSVNFGGGGSTTTDTVLGNPDGYLEVTITNNKYYVPYFL